MWSFLFVLIVNQPATALSESEWVDLAKKDIHLDLVVTYAIQVSDSFRLLQTADRMAEITYLQALVPLDWNLTSSVGISKSRAESATPFSPAESSGQTFGLGFAKQFVTGTQVAAQLDQTYSDARFASGSLIPSYNSHETKFSLQVSQKLWQDAFGRATRLNIAAQKTLAQSIVQEKADAIEGWALELIQVYYAAWLAQRSFETASEQGKRRQRLFEVTRARQNRGTAEIADVMQAEAGVLVVNNAIRESKKSVAEKWNFLVTTLKLPPVLLKTDPQSVRLKLDQEPKRAEEICSSDLLEKVQASSIIQKLNAQEEAARLRYDKMRAEQGLDLQLKGSYATNGIDQNLTNSLQETTQSKSPSWMVGLQLNYPLGEIAQTMQRKSSEVEQLRAELQKSLILGQKKVELMNECHDLRRSVSDIKSFRVISEKQNARFADEERRFRVGRGSTFAVIQAADDAALSEQQWRAQEVRLRLSGWKILRLSAELNPVLLEWIKKHESTR